MNYEEAHKFLEGLTEEQRIEAFQAALSLLNEEELANMMERCRDIIEAVEARIAAKEWFLPCIRLFIGIRKKKGMMLYTHTHNWCTDRFAVRMTAPVAAGAVSSFSSPFVYILEKYKVLLGFRVRFRNRR